MAQRLRDFDITYSSIMNVLCNRFSIFQIQQMVRHL